MTALPFIPMIDLPRRDLQFSIGVGVAIVAFGVRAILNPRLQLYRDQGLIESEEVGPGEKLGGQIMGIIFVAVGLGWLLFILVVPRIYNI